MIIGPKYKICRRLGSRVFGKCETTKFSISGSDKRRGGPTGRPTAGRRPRALSEYGQQLLEKQKARYTYLLKERQFTNYIKRVRASQKPTENPSARLYQELEGRLDNIVFRLGLAPTRAAARQLVSHGHIVVNGRRLNIPSHQLAVGDRVALRPESRRLPIAAWSEAPAEGQPKKVSLSPSWLAYDEVTKEGKVDARPLYGETESDVNFGAILEFYSRV